MLNIYFKWVNKMKRMKKVKNEEIDFTKMKKVKNKRLNYVDNGFHLYFSFWDRIVIKVVIFLLLILGSYYFLQKSFVFNTIDKIDYKLIGRATYEMNYNDYYVEGVDNQYLSDYVNNIDLNFNYDLGYSEQMSFLFNYKVDAILYIDSVESNKNLFTNTENLFTSNVVHKNNAVGYLMNVPINLDFKKYHEYVKNYELVNNVDAKAEVIVRLTGDFIGTHEDFNESIKKTTFVEVSIPVGGTETYVNLKNGGVNETDAFIEYNNGELVNDHYLFICIILFILGVMYFFEICLFIMSVMPKKSLYCRVRDNLLKEYDDIIVNTKKVPNIELFKIVECSTFKELVDAHNSVKKPIIFYEVVKNQKAVFMIVTSEEVYKYTLKEVDLENR